jgi:hypothetical protein
VFALDTGPLCSAGSGATCSPTSSLVLGPPTPSSPLAALGSSPRGRLPRVVGYFFASATTHDAVDSEFLVRYPWTGFWPEEIEGLPGCWAVPSRRAVTKHPAQVPLVSPCRLRELLPSGNYDALGPGLQTNFGADAHGSPSCLPTHRLLVTDAGARLTSERVGYSLLGRGSHPLDDFSEISCSLPHQASLSDQPCLVAP